MSTTFEKTDDGMQRLLAAMDEQIVNMGNSLNTVTSLRDDVATHYQSSAATAFGNKVADWMDHYNIVIKEVDQVREALNTSDRVFTQADDANRSQANSWSTTSADTFTALTHNG